MSFAEIETELVACLAAWAASPDAVLGWNIHHQDELEFLDETIEDRIEYILDDKDIEEIAVRFSNMHPALTASVEVLTAGTAAHKAYQDYKSGYGSWDDFIEKRAEFHSARNTWNPEERSAAHLADVPNHTWNGTDIFGGKDE